MFAHRFRHALMRCEGHGFYMKKLTIQKWTNSNGISGLRIQFNERAEPVFVARHHWIGVDFDGTLARNDILGPSDPPYPLGEPILEMVEIVKALAAAGVRIKIFTARGGEAQNIPVIQDWTEKCGLGRLEVTDRKDFNLVCFFDDRAIPTKCMAL